MQLLENVVRKKLRGWLCAFHMDCKETKSLKRFKNNAKTSIAVLPWV